MAASAKPKQAGREGRKKEQEMKCYLPPCLLQLIERVQGVILGGTWAQDLMVLLSSCQPAFGTAIHHLLESVEVSTLVSAYE